MQKSKSDSKEKTCFFMWFQAVFIKIIFAYNDLIQSPQLVEILLSY